VPKPLLLLFDIDGTLFMTSDPLVGRSVIQTLEEVYELELPANSISHVDHAGQTTKRIGRLVLEAAGVPDEEIEARLETWCPKVSERYLELLAKTSTAHWEVREGTAEALTELRDRGMRLTLLTGNPEPIARARMERLGLAEFFPAGQGGFGCDREIRHALIHLARERAGDWPASRTVEIGDTPRDVETAETAGVHSLALTTTKYDAKDLAKADAVVDTMSELVDVLVRWSGPA
jgi:phosphoglycolate phosphatase